MLSGQLLMTSKGIGRKGYDNSRFQNIHLVNVLMNLDVTHPLSVGRHAAPVYTENGSWENHLCKSTNPGNRLER